MLARLCSVLCALWFSTVATAKPAPPLPAPVDLSGFLREAPPCPSDASYCVGVVLHVVVKDGAPVATPAWFAGQLEVANTLFAPLKVGFTLQEARELPDTVLDIVTRADRNQLGRKRSVKAHANVYLVGSLADVDEIGHMLNGVHWRDTANKDRRWVILASTAWGLTLAHEFGHFFGLPHSSYDESIMNKSPRETPAPEDRIFAAPEVKKMEAESKRLFKAKELKQYKK